MVFTELNFNDRKLVKYTLNEGFEALFKRSLVSGARGGSRTHMPVLEAKDFKSFVSDQFHHPGVSEYFCRDVST